MKNRSKSKSAAVPRVDPYLEGLMAKLLERLVGLEKKIDVVIAQTTGKPVSEAKETPRRDRILYEAICADCHKVCEVPFKPSEDRAVYCKECFARRKSLPAGKQEAAMTRKAYPVLTPVAMPSKANHKPHAVSQMPPPANAAPKKAKKKSPTKKAKKKR